MALETIKKCTLLPMEAILRFLWDPYKCELYLVYLFSISYLNFMQHVQSCLRDVRLSVASKVDQDEDYGGSQELSHSLTYRFLQREHVMSEIDIISETTAHMWVFSAMKLTTRLIQKFPE